MPNSNPAPTLVPTEKLSETLNRIRQVNPRYSIESETNNGYQANGTYYFSRFTASTGAELWATNGTLAAARLVKDVNPDIGNFDTSSPKSSSPYGFVQLGNTVLFGASTEATGGELWRTDGTAAGTRLVKDLVPGVEDAYPSSLIVLGDRVLFTTSDYAANRNYNSTLWSTDGTEAGTRVVQAFDHNVSLFGAQVLQGELYFTDDTGGLGSELWKTNGTATGTVLVKDIIPGASGGNPNNLTVVGDRLFFSANPYGDGQSAATRGLWVSDGTSAGTQQVKPFEQTFVGGAGVNLNGTLYFTAADTATGYELWKSDGTAAGTVLVKDILPGPAVKNQRNPDAPQYPLYPENLTVANGKLFFSADDGIHGKELWTSDGTAAGTSLVVDLYQGEGIPFVVGKQGPTQNYPGLVPQGNDANPRDLVFVDNILYFTATDGSGRKLWQLPIGPNGEPGGLVPGPVTPPIGGSDGDDIVYGTIGDDKINVGNGWNRVYASEGRNFVQSGSGDDGIYGGGNTDVILAGAGRNEIYAGEGFNVVVTGSGYDQIYGGAGTDIVIAGNGFNAIYAGEGDNLTIGGNDGNQIYLGAGNDIVRTGSGHDTIYAGEGRNYIDAGTGWNTLYTGSGPDLFVLNQGDGFNIIKNFNLAQDKLGLVDGLTVGDLSARQIDSWGYLTEITVTRTGDVLAQLDGIHVTTDQLQFTTVDNSGSGFKRLTAGLLDQAFTATPDAALFAAAVQSGQLNGLI